jgi:hypothetical protein
VSLKNDCERRMNVGPGTPPTTRTSEHQLA